MLYVDASALVKLVVEEPESAALAAVVERAELVASELVLAEVPRAIDVVRPGRSARVVGALRDRAEAVLGAIALVSVDRALLIDAGALRAAWLRTLDAIHVVSALRVADHLDGFVTYDARQAEAADAAGFLVLAPA